MTATKPTPGWVCHLLRACTPDEQHAISEYRATVGKAHNRHRQGHLAWAQVVKIWTEALGTLANSAQGSPRLDKYLKRQLEHLEAWIKEES